MSQVDTLNRDSVLSLFDKMRFSEDGSKMLAAAKLEAMFSEFYADPAKFEYELDSIPFLGHLSSWDGAVRMLCWNLALATGEFKYHCILRHRPTKETVTVTVFQDTKSWDRIERKTVRPNKWYGALYYKILANRYRGKSYYTLIGWDGNDAITNRKVVDALVMQGSTVMLGANMFTTENRPAFRLIYKYANDATMALNYDKKEKMIVMDHLAPEDSRYTGQYQFYGPDFTYDGLKFDKGKWLLKKDLFPANRGLNNLPQEARPGDFKD